MLLVSSSESDSNNNDGDNRDSKKTKTKSQARPKPIRHVVVAATLTSSTVTPTSAGASKRKALTNITGTKVKSEAPIVKMESIPLVPVLTLDNSVNSDGLPEFAKAGWATSFLPTLYAYLSAAPKPFEPYAKGSNLVATVQAIVDIVYPRSGYRVKLTDKIYTMVKHVIIYCYLMLSLFLDP